VGVSVQARLSPDQLELLARHGEERTAAVGDVLFRVGDERYPLIAILEGEAAILDAHGDEVIRHGAGGFLGETNLLSGQIVFLTAVVTEAMRYIAVEREQLRELLFEYGPLSDLVLGTFIARREALQQREGVGFELIGPRSSGSTRALADYARRSRLPFTWIDTERDENEAAHALIAGLTDAELPLVRLPGGPDLRNPTAGEISRALGIGRELPPVEEVDLLIVGAGPSGLSAAVYGSSEGLDTLLVDGTFIGGQAGASRRIENYLGFPAGISGIELTVRAAQQARKFGARIASPYRATELVPGSDRHIVRLDGGNELRARSVVLATGAEYRRLPIADVEEYEGMSVFYAAGPPEARYCAAKRVAVVGGGNSAGQAAVWLARGGALVTLLHRRAELSETMSDYLIRELEPRGVVVRGRSEIVELHGKDGELEGVSLRDGTALALSYLFLFLGADPCTTWLGETLQLDEDGFVLTDEAAGAARPLETSVPGVFAVGDVRAGSVKRCATAVGEGAMVVRSIHDHLGARHAVGSRSRA
jgi:thioredoxin reductase (NADPH)